MDDRSRQLRLATLELSKANGGYHYGGSFSAVEILRVLYDDILTENDRFVLSKGHACWPYYVLLQERGYNPKLEGHPSRDPHNGIHCSTGSLGHGLPTAVGMALSKQIKEEFGRIYVLIGDGECQEGTTWESFLIASSHRLGNLVIIVDWNGIQGSDYTSNILRMPIGAIANNLLFRVQYINGHDVDALRNALMDTEQDLYHPHLIIAETVKGYGVSFMENLPQWHARWPNADEENQIRKELS